MTTEQASLDDSRASNLGKVVITIVRNDRTENLRANLLGAAIRVGVRGRARVACEGAGGDRAGSVCNRVLFGTDSVVLTVGSEVLNGAAIRISDGLPGCSAGDEKGNCKRLHCVSISNLITNINFCSNTLPLTRK